MLCMIVCTGLLAKYLEGCISIKEAIDKDKFQPLGMSRLAH